VIFSHLRKADLRRIVSLYAAKLNEMLKERGLSLDFSDAAFDLLLERGYDRDFGARPMKRVFQRLVQDPLSIEILAGRFAPGIRIRVGAEGGELRFSPEERQGARAVGHA
jgi:ATP-dependent Clp protease ATP-binding subunit ClpA